MYINKIIQFPSKIAVKLINIYQFYFSHDHSPYWSKIKRPACKYYPTCSEYTKQAILRFGLIKGSALGMWRILRCNPWSKGGVDKIKDERVEMKK
jgi:uncharacterized protein